jgi:ubiquinone/menaquinone biosynthesis C-methylase UbiE
MVNIHIHEFGPARDVLDAEALNLFELQWAAYKKLVDCDALSHAAVGRVLHDVLTERFDAPFTFLDIACGDASLARRALKGTSVARYHGIDLAVPALALAARTLEDTSWDVDLDHRNYIEALADRPEPADAVWCGLSIHHLPTGEKLQLMREVRGVTGDRGVFLIYEPTLSEGEDRQGYLARTWRIVPDRWTTLTSAEFSQLREHINNCDLPESAEGWLNLGRDAGFSHVRQIFTDPLDLYRMYQYEA